jgi:hypothetical protein
MEPTVTAEPISIFIMMIRASGLMGVIALPLSTLMLFVGIIGLLVNKARTRFYCWILGTLIKFNLLSCALMFSFGITKYGQIAGPRFSGNFEEVFIVTLLDMMGGAALILFVTFLAFIVKTLAEIKPNYKCQVK